MTNQFKFIAFLLLLLTGTTPGSYGQLENAIEYYDSIKNSAVNTTRSIAFIQEDANLVEEYSKLSQIILIRHGEPALNKKGWRKRSDAMQFIRDYDSVGVYRPNYSPVLMNGRELALINTSSIQRSISTASQVFPDQTNQIPNPLFREFERKIFSFPNIKLPLSWWLTTSRILWFTGLNKKGIESFSRAKDRALRAANYLEKDAQKEGKTLLVSHGLLNHYIAKYLKKNGWVTLYDGGKGYLSQKLLVKYEK